MMDYQGLKAAIIEMLSGADIRINIATFKNDIVSMKTKDDVLTYLIHLGYLGSVSYTHLTLPTTSRV